MHCMTGTNVWVAVKKEDNMLKRQNDCRKELHKAEIKIDHQKEKQEKQTEFDML